ncbi:MAG: FG-GAP repeat domain-containing protein [Phycisphaerae bacterium]
MAVAPATAAINPQFTPIHLTEQSDMVLLLEFKDGVGKDGKVKATVKKALKGKAPGESLTLDLPLEGDFAEQGKAAKAVIEGAKEGIVFIGTYQAAIKGASGGEDEQKGLLQIGGRWLVLNAGEKGVWEVANFDDDKASTWAGDTDTLRRVVEYILSDSEADVPVASQDQWGKAVNFGKVAGKIAAFQPLDLAGQVASWLYIASDGGDKLFAFKDGNLADMTGQRKLTAKSVASLWANFSGAKLDLLSFDGKALTLHRQQDDGTFTAAAVDVGDAAAGCTALCLAGSTGDGTLVIAAGDGWPVLLTISKDGKAVAKKLGEGDFPGKELGKGARSFVADFDGDGVADLLQVFPAGGLFYKGKAPGQFAAPAKSRIGLGKGQSFACLGDFDADGLLDVMATAEDATRIWHNGGAGQFAETLAVSGEIEHRGKGGGVWAAIGDINNDGRQGLVVAYGAMGTQIYFNRGFRSFGIAHSMDLDENKAVVPAVDSGQQAACMGDFAGRGAEDMTVALKDGQLWYLPRDFGKRTPLAVTLALKAGEGPVAPVVVTAQRRKRSMGAWNITPGGTPAFIGLPDAGPVTLTWKTPDGQVQKQEAVVVDKPIRVVLGAKK